MISFTGRTTAFQKVDDFFSCEVGLKFVMRDKSLTWTCAIHEEELNPMASNFTPSFFRWPSWWLRGPHNYTTIALQQESSGAGLLRNHNKCAIQDFTMINLTLEVADGTISFRSVSLRKKEGELWDCAIMLQWHDPLNFENGYYCVRPIRLTTW